MIDRMEVPKMALADFGIPVTVVPVSGFGAYPITALFDPATEQETLGQARGTLATHIFRCLPEDVPVLAEGDLLRIEPGNEYAVIEGGIVSVPFQMTEIHTVER